MELINSISNSRKVLKEVLSKEYKTENIPDYTNKEIEELYKLESTKDNPYNILGNGIACNITVEHRDLKDHHLHIVYYNFPVFGKSSSKVTKTIADKINILYANGTFKKTDNVIIIINENISDTIKNIINSLNINYQNMELDISKYDKSIYQKKHFRNVFIFNIKYIQTNILNHDLVPHHEVIRDINEINNILETCNCNLSQLPIIDKNDPVSKLHLGVIGDVFKIYRINKSCGNNVYYRVCR